MGAGPFSRVDFHAIFTLSAILRLREKNYRIYENVNSGYLYIWNKFFPNRAYRYWIIKKKFRHQFCRFKNIFPPLVETNLNFVQINFNLSVITMNVSEHQ